MINNIIIIIAEPERYIYGSPNLLLMSFTSFRIAFFSEAFISDLSISFISSNLSIKTLASAESTGSTGFVETKDDGALVFAAFDRSGKNVNDKHVAIIQKTIFFIMSDFINELI
jgi:hypothetical protein